MISMLNQPVELKPILQFQIRHLYSRLLIQEIKALTNRLFLQIWRRPATLMAGIIQPLLWLILFGGLFYNAPVNLFTINTSYNCFLSSGIIIFTSFTGALNSGLPLMFDREFGFLNRLLTAPLISRTSIILASATFMTFISLIQVIFIVVASLLMGNSPLNSDSTIIFALIILLITVGVTMLSLALSFTLPGHIELLALILVINLPFLFSSTALAPLYFMPPWLQLIASLNPLSYAIEGTRYLYSSIHWNFTECVIKISWGDVCLGQIIILLIVLDIAAAYIVAKILKAKLN
uniref:ABC-2 type transporter n=1 Tax=Pyropia perforata TaxID=182771 RepID=A0A023HRE9_PYRPE|nr:ABC-2 type transporter [Neoporphyra perforata]AGQ17135.1 ABC-2 type transporter [Neoporphyra perforata]AHB35307.1 ABC-2 type transporter [Neoporphyra perforata]AIA19469.1 ABC-2 type transporter [Neoporphyra perforata]AIA19678.1 ABC-2 type transporter [Neoporphyra perforata]AIA19887.1 ABC-2 type transporter [Neoporphyra perforata]